MHPRDSEREEGEAAFTLHSDIMGGHDGDNAMSRRASPETKRQHLAASCLNAAAGDYGAAPLVGPCVGGRVPRAPQFSGGE